MKLLLISLQSNAYVAGLKYIGANARANGHDVRILLLPGYIDSSLHPAIEDFIRDYNPDLIGISLMSIEFYPAKILTHLLHEKFSIPVLWGGVHVVLTPDECIKYADYVCCGEGERAVVLVLNHLRDKGRDVPPEVPNIWSRINGQIIKQPLSPPEENLDSLPYQEYLPEYYYFFHNDRIYNFSRHPELFRRYALYGGTCHMMITTRGCPFSCGYCANSSLVSVYGKKIRERSVENCLEELKAVKKDPYVLYINFEDDCFLVHGMKWLKKFTEEYKKHINLPFMVRAIPTMVDMEKLFMLKKAGLSWIIMGVQSGSDHVNFDIYGRKVPFAVVKKAAELVSKSRAVPYYEMIVDNPYETEQDMIETINAMSTLKKPYTTSLAHLTFFPGTPLTQKALKDKIIDPEAYLHRYMIEIEKTYFNKLLNITPYIPQFAVRFLNKTEASRKWLHSFLLQILHFVVRRTVEPAVYLFLIARSLDYKPDWIIRTIEGNWRSAVSKVVPNYPGKNDLKYGKKLTYLRKTMPELFERD
ncbi:MAG: B12-binding domain-containing radical SAM protein [Nitrospirae bacterium]|nr:B12-binding domain-containing radical SAM protein [Nitrospirota bacterium]